MSKERENKTNYRRHSEGNIGEVRIADEVVAIIAGLAATEVEGRSPPYCRPRCWHKA